MKPKFHYAYFIIASCIVIMCLPCALVLSCAGIFFTPVSEFFGVSRAQFTLYFSILNIFLQLRTGSSDDHYIIKIYASIIGNHAILYSTVTAVGIICFFLQIKYKVTTGFFLRINHKAVSIKCLRRIEGQLCTVAFILHSCINTRIAVIGIGIYHITIFKWFFYFNAPLIWIGSISKEKCFLCITVYINSCNGLKINPLNPHAKTYKEDEYYKNHR